MNVITALDGAPETDVRMTPAEVKGVDPGKLVIRLENRLSGLESLSSRSLSEIDQLTTEAAHARDDIARPFPQTDQLGAAHARVARLEEKLRQTAAPPQYSSNYGTTAAALHDVVAMTGIQRSADGQSGQRAHGPGGHLNCLRRRGRPPSAVAVALAAGRRAQG